MRTEDDLFLVEVTLTQSLILDREQLEFSPVFRAVRENLEASRFLLVTFEDVVQAYIEHYVANNAFPREMPGTTGPGVAANVKVEVKNDTSETGAHRNDEA